MGIRSAWWSAFFGRPSGPIGRLGAWLMTTRQATFRAALAGELDLAPDDDLLDVGCGSGRLLIEQAGHVGHVAGIDVSAIQVELARKGLADRIATGTAEIVLGDAEQLPWEDGRFSVVTSLNCLKFVSHPQLALGEMHRVLRPGGRAVVAVCDTPEGGSVKGVPSGRRNAWGEWSWSERDVRRLVEEAGFTNVTVGVLQILNKPWLAHGVKAAAAVTGGGAIPGLEAATRPEAVTGTGEPVQTEVARSR